MVEKRGMCILTTSPSNGLEVRILQSMPNIYDHLGNEMSVHYRIVNGVVEVIINRSCQKCESFHSIGGGDEVCNKCTYLKNWVERGKR